MTPSSGEFLDPGAPVDGAAENLRLTVADRSDGLGEVVVSGEIDFATHRTLLDALTEELNRGHHRIVLDLREVTFCDSTGLGVLVRVRQQAVAGGGWLRLVDPTSAVRRALAITNIDQLVPAYPTVADAVAG